MGPMDRKIESLPAELQQEVFDFVDFLLKKASKHEPRKLRQDWAGALQDFRGKYTSLQLQKKALAWRGD